LGDKISIERTSDRYFPLLNGYNTVMISISMNCKIERIQYAGVLNFFLKCRKQALRRKITVVNIFPIVLEIQGPANLPLHETGVEAAAGVDCHFIDSIAT